MAENSKIAWTNHTFNPWIGCTQVSEGCNNCYAENLMDRRYGRVQWGKGNPRSRTKTWKDPVKWNRLAEGATERPRVFCASLADYLDSDVDPSWREDLFALIDHCPNLDWLMLTKRIQDAPKLLPKSWLKNPRPWVWLGVTAENQRRWDERVPLLAKIPACVRFVSYEPSLGPVDMGSEGNQIDWLILGGESAQLHPARPFHLEWALDLIAQCRTMGIAPFMKQVGTCSFYKDKPLTITDSAGTKPEDWPKFARVREFPQSAVRS